MPSCGPNPVINDIRRVNVARGDITQQHDIAVIVNAAKSSLLGGGGVDGAIHRAAGPGLLVACKQIAVVSAEPPAQRYACSECGWEGTDPFHQIEDESHWYECPKCTVVVEPSPAVSTRGPELALTSTEVRCPAGEARITPAFKLPNDAIIHTVGPVYAQHTPERAAELLRVAYNSSCALAAGSGYETIAFPAISCGVYGYPYKEAAEIALEVAMKWTHRLKVTFVIFDSEVLVAFRNAHANAGLSAKLQMLLTGTTPSELLALKARLLVTNVAYAWTEFEGSAYAKAHRVGYAPGVMVRFYPITGHQVNLEQAALVTRRSKPRHINGGEEWLERCEPEEVQAAIDKSLAEQADYEAGNVWRWNVEHGHKGKGYAASPEAAMAACDEYMKSIGWILEAS